MCHYYHYYLLLLLKRTISGHVIEDFTSVCDTRLLACLQLLQVTGTQTSQHFTKLRLRYMHMRRPYFWRMAKKKKKGSLAERNFAKCAVKSTVAY